MSTKTVHIDCGLHFKWCVSAHHVARGKTFGREHADAWSHLMQYADGPKAFQAGVAILRKRYTPRPADGYPGDPDRLAYLEVLAKRPGTAHYGRAERFTCGVLTDVTESLFGAIKYYTNGNGRKGGVSLHSAMVRIIGGCLGLAQKKYVYPLAGSKLLKRIQNIKSTPVKKLFVHVAQILTKAATIFMLETYTESHQRFDLDKICIGDDMGFIAAKRQADQKGTCVTHKKYGDNHFVGTRKSTRHAWTQSVL